MPPVNKTGIAWKTGSPEEKKKFREYQRKYRAENLEKVKKSARTHALKKLYNLSYEDYERMVEEQKGLCAICNEKHQLYVDHCHSKNKVRKLLCNSCNLGLGMFKDNTVWLTKAAEYVK